MVRSSFECLPHSNTPIYLPSFLLQYNKGVKDMRNVNWEGSLAGYQTQLIDPDAFPGEEYTGPEQVFFSFKGKNCWLYEDEYCLLEPILDKVLEMTIDYSHELGVGPVQPIWDHCKPIAQQIEDGIEEFQHDLLSGHFRVKAVLDL